MNLFLTIFSEFYDGGLVIQIPAVSALLCVLLVIGKYARRFFLGLELFESSDDA
jgi:hypothetical protein